VLWTPTQQTRKAQARINRLRRRRRIARSLLFLFVFFGITAASTPSTQALLVQVNDITAAYRFDFVNWESKAVTNEIGRRIVPPSLPLTEAERRNMIYQFIQYEEYIRDIEGKLNGVYAHNNGPEQEIITLEEELAATRLAQVKIKPQVEIILSQQVEEVLRQEGFAIGRQVFPPVAFRLVDPPTNLILSPRDKIVNQHSVQLEPGLDYKTRFEIEAAIDQHGDVSSYITNVGGLGSYPTMVLKHPHLIWLVEVIAHEWAHNYFLTVPTNLGWGYQTYPELTTINETTADIIGKEIAHKIITRFYPEWINELQPLDNYGLPISDEPSEFHLAMRKIRLEVDQLLTAGKIEEAEAFMELERQKLVARGHNLRKLNQAYFAFHGSYALSPGSVDPIGPQLHQLRASSTSLKDFVDKVVWLNNFDDYLQWLDEAGIQNTTRK
jgi:hypothetical protein